MNVGISGYVGNKLTGIGRVLIEILKELACINKNDIYYLFSNYDFNEYDCLKIYTNIIIVRISISKNSPIKNILWHQYGFQHKITEYKCEIAYIPNFSLLLWKKVPTIVTIHDLIEYNIPNKFSRLRMTYRKIIDPLMVKNSSFITTVSLCSKNDIIKFCGAKESKIQVIPNATDRNKFKKYTDDDINNCLKKYDLRKNEYFLFVGTIDYPGKNIKIILDAFFDLKKAYNIREKLLIVGKDGYNSSIIYNYVNTSIYKDEVIFVGYLPDNELPLFYAGAEVMLYLSLYEGFGLPVLEAMSCGTAVICPNTSCFPEVVGDIDICVSPTDVKAVEEKLYKLAKDIEYRNIISSKCYERASIYSWQKSAELYYEAFKKNCI